jgi:genome maintenance exonuclease 1
VQEIAYGWMFFERYNMEVKKFVTIIACENGETQVFEIFDKKTYYEKLNEYINYFFSTQANV